MADQPGRHRLAGIRDGAIGLGVATVAIVCCAAWPVLIALVGGVSVVAALGIGAGVIALLLALAGAVAFVGRTRTGRPRER